MTDDVPIEAIGAVVLYLQDCRYRKAKLSESELARAAVNAADQARQRQAVNIARCPEHGLHGERTECFVCGGPVEQVPMYPLPAL